MKNKKANIIFVLADQLRYQSCGYAGDALAHTPNIDYFPPKEFLFRRPQRQCLTGSSGAEPEFTFLQNTGACAAWEDGHEWRALRDKQYTYAVYKVDVKELLFDNINDPFQMNNLATNPAYCQKVESFRKALKKKMESLNDSFENSTWHRDNWVSEDRKILRSATLN